MLCGERNKLLYEARPDIFPEGYLTDTEVALWSLYYEDRNKKG